MQFARYMIKLLPFLLGYDVNWEDETDIITCPYTLSHKAAVDEEVNILS